MPARSRSRPDRHYCGRLNLLYDPARSDLGVDLPERDDAEAFSPCKPESADRLDTKLLIPAL